MKKKYIIPTLDVINAQMIGAICVGSGEKTPESDPNPDGNPNAAPKVV